MTFLEKISAYFERRRQRKQFNDYAEYWVRKFTLDTQKLQIKDLRAGQKQLRQLQKIQAFFKESKEKDRYIV